MWLGHTWPSIYPCQQGLPVVDLELLWPWFWYGFVPECLKERVTSWSDYIYIIPVVLFPSNTRQTQEGMTMPSTIPIFDEQTAKKLQKVLFFLIPRNTVLFMYYYIICCSYYIFKGLLLTFLAKCYYVICSKTLLHYLILEKHVDECS